MDVRCMAFDDESFDVVVDKGCLDAILCSEGSHPSMLAMFREINRVLKRDGVYICVSHGT
jgi:ubiquinone/menaquinone biosynthesis C-methylase UbiE